MFTVLKLYIPLLANRSSHPFVRLAARTAYAGSQGQERPSAGALWPRLAAAGVQAGWSRSGVRLLRRCTALLAVGVLTFGAGLPTVAAQTVSTMGSAIVDPYAACVTEASRRFSVPELWIRAVLRAESAGDVRAVSSAGALGLMQIMPDTWAELRVRYQLGGDPYDPHANILAGAAYLREMWDRYGSVDAMLAAYNAGPGRYDAYRSTGSKLPVETRSYVDTLAPVLGGPASPSMVMHPPRRSVDWRKAMLFVVRPNDERNAAGVPSDARSDGVRAVAPRRPDAYAKPRDSGLFVARAGDGGARW